MQFDGLYGSYWRTQQDRVGRLLSRINEVGTPDQGRVVPSEESLVLGEGKRLQLAVLFLDICGFSERPSFTHLDQSLNLQMLNLFFTEMVRIAEDYGGEVEKNTGDGLLAYFPDGPQTLGVSASQKALASALTMLAATEYLINPILQRSSVLDIAFRVSIDYGPVTIAKIGAGRGFNSTVAIGTPANFACKMLAHASPREIVLGAAAKTQLPTDWQETYCRLATLNTGWNYTLSGLPYVLYKYVGRWSGLV